VGVALDLSIAIGDYDRVRPLAQGRVRIDGCEPVFMHLEPEEIFFRAFRQQAFDVCELSLSTFALRTARGDCPYVGVPVFPSRAFRHTAIYIRTDRGIGRPEDLKGKRIGIPEYQLTANVWARAILLDDHGVDPSHIRWIQGGQEEPGRIEKAAFGLPEGVRINPAPEGKTLSGMLEAGEIDGLIAPRAPSCFARRAPNVGWLFNDPQAAAADWFRRTGVFPIMHLLGVRRSLVEQHPWLPVALLKAFEQSKRLAMEALAEPAAPKVMLPFLDEQVRAAQALMGEDWWPYGLEKNRATLETFLQHHHRQGLSPRKLEPEALFDPSTLEGFKV
jgi:4,5-dihydroxyphthalate decarboxylase